MRHGSHALDGDIVQRLSDFLSTLSAEDVAELARWFHLLHQQAYRSELWAAGSLLQGRLSDDGFTDFRTWLIANGQALYEAVLADPDGALARIPRRVNSEEWGFAESYCDEVYRIYEQHWGEMPIDLDVDFIGVEPSGSDFPRDDPSWFRKHYPMLSQRLESI